ncbi:MAG TPA: FAD-binding protein [Gemmatimonadaceae bacterium]|nr:FAD-binding protein [Gemmatimonadaceae bacterium]
MLADTIRDARARRQGLRIVAGQSWLDAGRPVDATHTLSVAESRGIIEYVPGDLTLTARAGTSIAELYEATRAHGQWLPLDPWGVDTGTLGATITTATPGPHAHAMGLPRDVVLGLEFVSGAGDTIRAGGRVVKNVAGFDLTRLVIGSWGTLGVVTEVTVRLRARPQSMRTLLLQPRADAAALNELAVKLRALPFTPLAAELVNAGLAMRLGVAKAAALIVRLGGNDVSVARQLDLLRALGPFDDAADAVWGALRQADAGSIASWRWAALPSAFGDTWVAADAAAQRLGDAGVSGSAMRGVVRVSARSLHDIPQVMKTVQAFPGSVVLEKLPAGAWQFVRPRAHDTLHGMLRRRFDPDGVLNPGIMGMMP